MATKAFKDMTFDELTEHLTSIKKQKEELTDEARAAKVIQNRLIQEQHVAEATRSLTEWGSKNGMTLEAAAEYWQGRMVDDGGRLDPGRWVQSNLVLGKPANVRA